MVILFMLTLLSFSSCHVARYVWWNFADIDDCHKFPANPVQPASVSTPWTCAEVPVVPVVNHLEGEPISDFNGFLEKNHTVACIVIRNDTLIYEKYFDGYCRSSVLPSFSVAKSFVSAFIGIAIADGKIRSVDQPVTDFLPELKDRRFQKVTIKHLLEMRSGIQFKEAYGNPFSGMAKFYYGLNLKKYTLSLTIADSADRFYNYQSANTQLLAMVLERATGKSLSGYLEEKIWKPMGAEYAASWSIDSRSDQQTKAFCCINARAVDFAKFGQLILDSGIMGGDTIIPPSWVTESLTIQTDSRDSGGFPYTYHWRVTQEGDFFAKGVLGQYIYVCPKKNIVIVRFGKKSGKVSWPGFFRQICRSL